MSEDQTPPIEPELKPLPIIGTSNVTVYRFPPDFCRNEDEVRKEAKRKADHAHNLRMQQARRNGGKVRPF